MVLKRPRPNEPPASYRLLDDSAVFYRRVSPEEADSIRSLGRLTPPPGGIPEGKYLTTTPQLAQAWGEQMVKCGWETSIGAVFEVRIGAGIAIGVHYVGEIDGIGAAYFATLDELQCAALSEVKL